MSENVSICHILLKSSFFWATFLSGQYGSNFNQRDVIDRRITELDKITQTNGHYAVQGHSMSRISVPVERPYATSYGSVVVT